MSEINSQHNYLHKGLADLPGEIWKDIPGFEGSYQASNCGRVKSLDRIVPHPRLKQQFVKGRILSQSVSKNKNIKTGEPMIDLRASLSIEGLPYYFNTRRLIYQTFIYQNLNYDKDGLYVINLDNNGYNNRPENLKLCTKSEKQKRAIKRDRVLPYLKTADRSNWPKIYGGYSRKKPVGQYDLNGNLIHQYSSVREASRQVKLDDKAIIGVAKGIYKQWNGFIWRYI
ncbi:NUMOD4 domain-containing protein [Mucilaginibacter lappiensis]|uniref:NUMOD4 motif-containing protein n=1 Tax=Mucilaginibacter lappiensis TaxID=354630 RepID=A0A841JE35_9SPHI|nr:NUMOD4 domain-containing protein [Mucilaginibacter lappiensis]MBB6126351.1 hypothetical protein [Mucilaginibacter lappiensis]